MSTSAIRRPRAKQPLLTAAAAVVLSLGATRIGAEPQASPAITADRCPSSFPADWRCLRVAVQADYAVPGGVRAEVRVVVAPALHPKADPEAVFLLQGGPGVSGTEVAGQGFIASIGALQATHDLVVVDERQVFGPDALVCPPSGPPEKLVSWDQNVFSRAHLASCLARSAAKANLETLTTSTFARDMDGVRAALGYAAVELYAVNYGGLIAQEYMRRFPGRVRAAVLADTGPTDEPIVWSIGYRTIRAVKATLAACRADAPCHHAFPTIEAEFEALMRRVGATGLSATIASPKGTDTVVFDRGTLLGFFAAHFHFMRNVADLPYEIHELASGDPARIGAIADEIVGYQRAMFGRLALGVWMSVECTEEAPRMRARLAHGERPGSDRVAAVVAACETWPHVQPPRDFHDPVRSDVPVLLLASPMEPAYPAELAARAASGFSHFRIIVDANHGHVFDDDWQMCLGPQAVAFLDSLDLSAVDARCAARFGFRPFKLRK